MNKKVIIIAVIILAIISIAVVSIKNNKSKNSKDERFEPGYCEGHYGTVAGDALTPWTCKICGYSDINSDTFTPIICNKCANRTGRCMYCGKLKK